MTQQSANEIERVRKKSEKFPDFSIDYLMSQISKLLKSVSLL